MFSMFVNLRYMWVCVCIYTHICVYMYIIYILQTYYIRYILVHIWKVLQLNGRIYWTPGESSLNRITFSWWSFGEFSSATGNSFPQRPLSTCRDRVECRTASALATEPTLLRHLVLHFQCEVFSLDHFEFN